MVGTHAVIQDEVRFARLGLAIIDEQHRFGVQQRLALRAKLRAQPGELEPHLLMMSATPIPRTLAMTLLRRPGRQHHRRAAARAARRC